MNKKRKIWKTRKDGVKQCYGVDKNETLIPPYLKQEIEFIHKYCKRYPIQFLFEQEGLV